MADQVFLYSRTSQTREVDHLLGFADPHDFLSEVNHRISNNLALLASTVSMRAASFSRRKDGISGQEVATALHEVTARIAIVGHMHRLLSAQPGADRTGFGAHFRELGRLFVSALTAPGQWELVDSDALDCPVNAEHFLPLSLIVTEVVTNALKYAHPAGAPGKLTIGCRREEHGTIVIEVSDDGVGFPEGFQFAAGGGIGSRTIHVLAQQIGAEIGFESRATGLHFHLRLLADDPGSDLAA